MTSPDLAEANIDRLAELFPTSSPRSSTPMGIPIGHVDF